MFTDEKKYLDEASKEAANKFGKTTMFLHGLVKMNFESFVDGMQKNFGKNLGFDLWVESEFDGAVHFALMSTTSFTDICSVAVNPLTFEYNVEVHSKQSYIRLKERIELFFDRLEELMHQLTKYNDACKM